MNYINFKSNYNRFPKIAVNGFENTLIKGYNNIVEKLREQLTDKKVLIIETYPGVCYEEILNNLIKPLNPATIIFSDEAALSPLDFEKKMQYNITDDRVFGIMSYHKLIDCFYKNKLNEFKKQVESSDGITIIFGVGASLVYKADLLVYCDLARWEIQQRFRAGMPNWRTNNKNEDKLRKFKRGYFVEWRIADRHKKSLYQDIDFLMDTNIKNNPKMVSGEAFLSGLEQTAKRPFRLVPYFDSGVWGGQWMKEVCNLEQDKLNYAWSIDGVPEENSIYLDFVNDYIEVPALNVIFRHPVELLGNKVHARFGTEFPIRFDFLDTMNGQNLSLQVHPLTEYIQEQFGMNYTQDESYYLLEADDDAVVYLGLKNNVNKEELFNDLRRAQDGEIIFPDEKYINKFPAKKHDHFLIPAGTIHCSGSNSMVLEISATPYIFTFKLWDWGRFGLDGLPRPVHIDHGEKVVQVDRDTDWVKSNLINQIETISNADGIKEEKTGLHEREFIETRRHWSRKKVYHKTNGSVNVLNLVEGKEAIVESPNNAFEPFIVNYAETFIIPASIEEYTIRPYGKSKGETIATIKAYIRV